MKAQKIIHLILSPTYLFKSIKLFIVIHKYGFGQHNSFPVNTNVVGGENIQIGKENTFGLSIRLHTWKYYFGQLTGYQSQMIIGDNNYFGSNCYITALDKVIIGNGCCFGDNVYISDNLHGNPKGLHDDKLIPPLERQLYSKGPVIIGDNVWVGRNVCILGNVKIGDNSIIGANSVVTHDVEPNSIYAGCPARKIG